MAAPLLIFDCDGVLIDSEVIYLEVEIAYLQSMGVTVDRAWYVGEFMALAADLWRAKFIGLIAERTGYALTDGDFERLKSESRRRVTEEVKLVDGAEAMLADTGNRTRCVASSTRLAFLHRKLDQMNLARFFGDGVFSGDMVANGKPAPDLFLYAASQMGHAPTDCIVIEDSVNGVRGGKAAGQFVIGFTGGSHCLNGHGETLHKAGADMIVSSHGELSQWLASRSE